MPVSWFGGFANLESDPFDADGPDQIHDPDDVAMTAIAIPMDEDPGLGIGFLEISQSGGEFVKFDGSAVEVGCAGLVDGDVGDEFGRIRGGLAGGGQIHIQRSGVDHAEADEHKGGEEKEHDVDQGDDLDAGLLAGAGDLGAELDGHGDSGSLGFWGWAPLGPLGLTLGKRFKVVAVMTGGSGEEFDVMDGPFQPGPEAVDLAIEIVERKQAKDGDAETAGGGNEGFGDAAAHAGG